ncbi:MAG: PQQ-dependent sugar dehydrogenase [Pirellulaceae bacterium]|nr:PQQ-dependent sugar dehydrogenase [Pirellulaceae bacterium]
MRALFSVALVGLFAGSAVAADEPPVKPAFECRWLTGPITIDGVADEDAWKNAQVIDKFSLPWLKDKARPARTATRARLLWDSENFYFFADMDDADLYADITERDGQTWSNDVFEVFFKPHTDKPGYYEFQVNAAGTEMDMYLPKRGTGGYQRYKGDTEFHLKTAVKLRGTLNKWSDKDEGWSVEGQIPWRDFGKTGGKPEIGVTWGLALCRYDYSVDFEGPDLSTCAPLSVSNFHWHEDYARLRFLGPDGEARLPAGLKNRVPLLTSAVVGSPDPPLPYRPVRAFPNLQLTFPIALDRVPGTSDLLIITQGKSYAATTIYRLADDPAVTEPVPLLETPGGGTAYGICFHPKFADNGYLYVGWNGRLDKESKDPKKCFITRYTWDRATRTIDANSALHIVSWESDGHNGADVEFGLDGKLLITSGDGTSDSDTNLRGQEMSHLTAKLLRIDVDRPEKDRPYSVPADNPFVGREGIAPETWAYGFRNPWRLAVDPKTGHVWVGNNGQDLWEQVFFVRKGDNFGWSVYEGGHVFYAERKLGPTPHVLPAADHPHSEARSLTGGVVYHGQKLPELAGAYIYGDHSTGRIWGIRHDGTKVTWNKLLADTTFNISGFGLDSRGELLVADHRANGEGAFYYLEPAAPVAAPGKFPRKLSDSGLFVSVKDHALQPGVIPYSVNSPLWSDGAHKQRYIAIPERPAQDMRIEFVAGARAWKFPDETVLVKSFALETKPGDPASRRWIETRFMTKQEGEWVGYSYRWNDEQTDAELVPAEGADADYDTGGKTRQKWHFPSRVECMVCHSRAANFVLGLSELQLNREHDYGGVSENQIQLLARLGMLKGKTPANPDPAQRLADPYDAQAPLEDRVRSYLHVNCASCHVGAGGGNAKLQLDYGTKLADMKLVDEEPVHHKFGLADPRIVVPGDPARSILLHRLSHRGPNSGQMPQLATYLVDQPAVKLFEEWIRTVKLPDPAPEPPKSATK